MRILLGLALAVTLAANATAATFKIGYGNAVGTVSYPKTDDSGAARDVANADDDVSHGLIAIGVEMMEPVVGPLSLGIEIGVGLPAGDYTLDTKDAYVPPAGVVHKFDGDEITMTMTTVPILAKASAAFEVGPGEIRAGLGLGALIMSAKSEVTLTTWNNPIAGVDPNKLEAAATVDSVDTQWNSGGVGVFLAQITPGYHLKIGEKGA
ncbi:MAG: hypothetical protein E3J64_05890, partial [Anaerolineales bacterium]